MGPVLGDPAGSRKTKLVVSLYFNKEALKGHLKSRGFGRAWQLLR